MTVKFRIQWMTGLWIYAALLD